MFRKKKSVFITTFFVLILSGVFFADPANSNIASKEYVDRKASSVDTSQVASYEIKRALIENANTGDEVSVEMDGIRFLARKVNTNANWWSVRIKNEADKVISVGITFLHFYGGYQNYNRTVNIAVGEEYNPDGQSGDVGYGVSDTIFMHIFDLTNNHLYRVSVTVNIKRALVVVEKLY